MVQPEPTAPAPVAIETPKIAGEAHREIWHAEIVDRALDGFLELIPAEQVDVFDVPIERIRVMLTLREGSTLGQGAQLEVLT